MKIPYSERAIGDYCPQNFTAASVFVTDTLLMVTAAPCFHTMKKSFHLTGKLLLLPADSSGR